MQTDLYMGIDCSTQSFTATLIDIENSKIVITKSLNFEKDFPQYNTSSGTVSSEENPTVVYSYADMWVEALDKVLELLSKEIDLARVRAIGGSGQQHASVYLKSLDVFNLDGVESLSNHVKEYLSRRESPIWMDTSTSLECKEISESVGGEGEVLKITGSVMTERFTASQIRKFSKENSQAYANTKRIHLNSSFICSILAGKDSPIDCGDGAGMNLMDLETLSWSDKMLEATSDNLKSKLPALCISDTKVGTIAQYFSKKYGFLDNTAIVAFTGDNPSSLIGVGAMLEGCAAISLGTSDTFFSSISELSPADNAHIFGNPAGNYMNLVCFRNGSLAREKMKALVDVDWNFFDNTAFENYEPKDDGKLILPFFLDEISPKLKSEAPIFIPDDNMTLAEKVIYTIEGQFLNMYLQAKKMSSAKINSIVLTGGASKSDGIAQVIADVFQARVGRLKQSLNSAALGAAMRAAKNNTEVSWESLSEKFCEQTDFKEARSEYASIYEQKAQKFALAQSDIYGI